MKKDKQLEKAVTPTAYLIKNIPRENFYKKG